MQTERAPALVPDQQTRKASARRVQAGRIALSDCDPRASPSAAPELLDNRRLVTPVARILSSAASFRSDNLLDRDPSGPRHVRTHFWQRNIAHSEMQAQLSRRR